MQYKPHKYQRIAFGHILDNPYGALFQEMGLGKTVITLTALDWLIYQNVEIRKCLIIAPYNVAQTTWKDEIEKWDHVCHLKYSIVMGSVAERMAALKAKADIYVINRENVAWLVTHYMSGWPFDMVVIDELSSFKSHSSQRFRALRMIRPFCKRVLGLTGTPAPNGLADLWSQIYLLDKGERLGATVTSYRNEYLNVAKSNGHIVYKYGCSDENAKRIYKKLEDICVSMKAEDYLDLPKKIERLYKIKMDKALHKKYVEFEKTQVLQMFDTEEAKISAVNAAALTTKLLQFSNGAVYNNDKKGWTRIHDRKLDALEEIIDAAQGEPVLVFYSYKHDLERIQKRFGGEVLKKGSVKRWNDKKIPLLIAHPKSAAHGLNMQAGGSIIVWFGMTWSLEDWLQANARLHRQGQVKPVIIHKIVVEGTMDIDTMRAIKRKDAGQNAMMKALRVRYIHYKNAA